MTLRRKNKLTNTAFYYTLTSNNYILCTTDIGTIGISDHAQAELSDVVFVDLPEVGATVAAGDPVAVVESVKAASDVYTPVSGEILEVNEELSNDPSLINSDPYGAGWLYKIRLDVPTETEDMMNATDYEEYCS